jgi:uncharacterized RDD family membrane protein YckC
MVPPSPQLNRLVSLSGKHPGFWLRFAAVFIDSLILSVAGMIGGFVIGFAMAGGLGMRDKNVLQAYGFILGLVLGWLYFALMESSPKQATLGKMACGYVVSDLRGARVSFARATGRHFGKWISTLILGIGFLMCAWSRQKQCLHDKMAGCLMFKM